MLNTKKMYFICLGFWISLLLMISCDSGGGSSRTDTTSNTSTETATDTAEEQVEQTECGPRVGNDICHVIAFGGKERRFWQHTPDNISERPALLIGLHGLRAGTSGVDFLMGIRELADKQGYLAFLPAAIDLSEDTGVWNSFLDCCDNAIGVLSIEEQEAWSEISTFIEGLDDVSFLSHLIDFAVTEQQADPERVYIAGHSNGSMMAYRMACDAAEKVTAIIALAGTLETETERCQPQRPLGVMHLHSLADGTVPYDGGPPGDSAINILIEGFLEAVGSTLQLNERTREFVGNNFTLSSARQSVDRWAEINGCSLPNEGGDAPIADERIHLLADDAKAIDSTKVSFQHCSKPTELVVLDESAGHVPVFDREALHPLIVKFLEASTP